MTDLIERTRLVAKILRDIGGQSAMAATVEEAAAALESAREDAAGWRQAFVSERARHNRERGMSIEQARIHAETDAEIAAIDQARGKGEQETPK